MKKYILNMRVLLPLILLLGLLLRLYKITSPILDLYPIRQEQCAMIARNFFLHGYNIFHPEVDWFGNLDSSWRLEFPLVSYLAAIFYALFGIREVLGRLISVIFSLSSIYFVFLLAKKVFNHRTALYAAFLFAVSPLSVYFGRAFMPEMAMIFFSLASLYYLYSWIDSDRLSEYFIALICFSLSLLVKLPTLYLCLPLLYLFYSKYRSKLFLKPNLYLFFLFAFTPVLFWYLGASNNMLTFYLAHKSNIYMLMQPFFYRRIFESLALLALTPIGLMMAVWGVFLSIKSKREGVFYCWLIAVIIYTFLAAEANYTHYYYQLPFVPVLSIFAAKVLDRLTEPATFKESIFAKINPKFIVVLTLILILIISFLTIQPFYKYNLNTYFSTKKVNLLIEKDAILIAGRCAQEAPLYYTNRKGWETNEAPQGGGSLAYSWSANLNKYNLPYRNVRDGLKMPNEAGLVRLLIDYGANYYFTVNLKVFDEEPEFRDYMFNNFKVIANKDNFILFKLDKK